LGFKERCYFLAGLAGAEGAPLMTEARGRA
jgi:hypothetical protein